MIPLFYCSEMKQALEESALRKTHSAVRARLLKAERQFVNDDIELLHGKIV